MLSRVRARTLGGKRHCLSGGRRLQSTRRSVLPRSAQYSLPRTCTNPIPLAKINRMKLVINGEERSLEGPLTLTGLLTRLDMKSDRVAVELNLDIVPRDQWTTTNLVEGDRLEIVHFVGGGSSAWLCVDGES